MREMRGRFWSARSWDRTNISIVVLIVVALSTQIPANFGSLYGEQDAARLAVDALVWAHTGARNEALSEYRYYTSPGYVTLIFGVLPVARVAEIHLARILGLVNLLLAVTIVIPVYRLATRLTDPSTALFSGLAMLFMPMVWYAGTYGFPHLPAVFCLICAYLVYDRHLTGPPLIGQGADFVVIVILLTTSVLLKADAYLGAAGLPALLLVRRVCSIHRIAIVAFLLAVPVCVSAAATQLLLQASPTVVDYMQGYERQYPFALWHWRSWPIVEGWLMAFGFYTIPVFAFGLVVTLATRRWPLAAMLLLWVVVPMAFWFFRPGDSARHHLPEAFPVAMGVGIALSTLAARKRWVPYIALAMLICANYLKYPAWDQDFPIRPSGRVLESAGLIRERVTRFHRLAEAYEATAPSRKVLLGTVSNPYVDGEVLWRAEQVVSVVRGPLLGYDAIQIFSRRNGQERFSASVRVNTKDAPIAARLFRQRGYTPYSIEYDLATGKRNVTWQLSTLRPQ